MKKFLLLPLLISSIVISSIFSATPVHAAVIAPSQCNLAKNQSFACLGEAVNKNILGDAYRTLENSSRSTADLTMGLLITFDVLLGSGNSSTANTTGSAYNFPPNPFVEGGGALGALNQGIAAVYTYPPNRFADKDLFFREALANNILNPAPAHAASFGFGTDLLNTMSFLPLWKLFRNIAYLGLAAALAIFGLMVMFRAKADPRTTVTFQMALPRVAVALVLIYFSLPLAGLAMDVAEVGSQVIFGFFCPLGGTCPMPAPGSGVTNWPLKADFGEMFNKFVMGQGTLNVTFGIGNEPFPGFNKLLELLIRFFAFSVLLKVFWTLISRYVAFLVQALIAPLQILMGVFPGQEGGGTRWYRQLLANTLTFPGVFLVINIANVFANASIPLPWIINPTTSGITKPSEISALLAIGVLSLAPKVPALLEEMFDVVPGAHSSRAGSDPGSMLKGLPVFGKMMG